MPNTNGSITLAGPAPGATGPGARVSGNSLALDTSGGNATGTGVTNSAANIFISARSVNFGTVRQGAGFNVSDSIAAQLQQATNLTLRSAQTIDFSGSSVAFALGAGSHLVLDGAALLSRTTGNTVQLRADQIDLVNTGSAKTQAAAGNATLNLTASQVTFRERRSSR